MKTKCCMNCGNGETAIEKHGDAMHEYEAEDVYCLETYELETYGETHVCDKWKEKTT